MPYAILRIKKLKTKGAINAVGQHNERKRETLNANPAVPNRDLLNPARAPSPVGKAASEGAATDPSQAAPGEAWEAVQGRIAEVGARIRSNGVLACEVFMGASPEYFRPTGGSAGTWDEKQLAGWVPAAMTWLKQEWGEQNVVRAVLHLDETTPHIQAIVVPIDPDSQRMNACRWLGGKPKMAQMQNRHAEAVQGLGLERGIKGSLAHHTDIKAWYAHLQQDVPEVPIPEVQVPDVMMWKSIREAFATQETSRLGAAQQPAVEALETQARARRLAESKQRDAEATSKRLVKELKAEREARATSEGKLKQQVAELHNEKEVLQRQLDAVRDVPLTEAATWFDPEELTAVGVRIGKDAAGRERIFGADGRVVGRNPIDLTLAVHGCKDAGEAAAWIEVRRGRGTANRALRSSTNLDDLQDKARPYREVVRDAKHGMLVERYQRAQEQVEQRKPPTWEGVQGIFKRMRLDLSRAWKAAGAVYTLVDSLFNNSGTIDPPDPSDPVKFPREQAFWGRVLELERADRARIKREEEQAAIQRANMHRGPRR